MKNKIPDERDDATVLTAYHEAAHVVLACALTSSPLSVTIEPGEDHGGRMWPHAMAGQNPIGEIQVMLAGAVAVDLLTHCEGDSLLSSDWPGHEEKDDFPRAKQRIRSMGASTDEALHERLQFFYQVTLEALEAVWPTVEAVACSLRARTTLERDEIYELTCGGDIFAKVNAVQKKHRLTLKLVDNEAPHGS